MHKYYKETCFENAKVEGFVFSWWEKVETFPFDSEKFGDISTVIKVKNPIVKYHLDYNLQKTNKKK